MPLLASWLAVSMKRIGDEEDDKLISNLLGRCLIPVHHVPFFGRLFETLFSASPFSGQMSGLSWNRPTIAFSVGLKTTFNAHHRIHRAKSPASDTARRLSSSSVHLNSRRIKQPSKEARSRARRDQHAQVPDTRIPNPEPCMHRRPDYAGP